MNSDDVTKNMTISGPEWPEPVYVASIQQYGEQHKHIKGWLVHSRAVVDDIVPLESFADMTTENLPADVSGDPVKVFLAIEALRYETTSQFDSLLGMHASRVDPLPHQIEAVYQYVLRMPRIRFMLAHDPGAGKTIMAGLIIKELKIRKVVSSVLVVAPGHLKYQWQNELQNKFDEYSVIVDRNYINTHRFENTWKSNDVLITSLDFAKQDDILQSLNSTSFDLVIVDEAHKMSAYKYGSQIGKSDRYKLGEILSKCSDNMLFLTATPHQGNTDNFKLLLDLLEPGFFATPEMITSSIKNADNPLFLRRTKENMVGFDGKQLFVPRHVRTLEINLTAPEMNLYKRTSEYVQLQYNKALQSTKYRNVAFALIILQRRLASSVYALTNSLRRRQHKLQEILDTSYPLDDSRIELSNTDELKEEERWRVEEKWELLSVAENRAEVDAEITTLRELIDAAEKVIRDGSESKLQQFEDALKDLDRNYPNEKILVFTESKDTLQYLANNIRKWGYSVHTIHGGMNTNERMHAQNVFKNKTRIMVATEAAGEGINLQFCHLMINYDLPWNPNRLEQRMGRIHRYGQKFEVTVFNMVATNTREGQIMKSLFDKLDQIKLDLNTESVFEVITELISDKKLSELMTSAVVNARDIEDILQDLATNIDREYDRKIKNAMNDSLATKYMNPELLSEMDSDAEAHKLNPEYTTEMFRIAIELAGGTMHTRTDGLVSINNIPASLREMAKHSKYQGRYKLLDRYNKITFDKKMPDDPEVEFVVFGHPLFDIILEWIKKTCLVDAQRGTMFVDPDGVRDGYIMFHIVELKDGTGSVAGKKLVSHFINANMDEVHEVQPTILWDMKYGSTCNVPVYKEKAERTVQENVLKCALQYQNEVLIERRRQADVKQRYGLTSLRKSISDLDEELKVLHARQTSGEDVRLVTHNKKERRDSHKQRYNELNLQIEQVQKLTMVLPRLVGWVRVSPAPTALGDQRTSQDVEQVGMRAAMEYEIKSGREPTDVSNKNVGYDIKSRYKDGSVRYIEVKARAGTGKISMTPNEYKVAKNLGNSYYLYVVYDTSTKPRILVTSLTTLDITRVEARYDISPDEVEAKSEQSGTYTGEI